MFSKKISLTCRATIEGKPAYPNVQLFILFYRKEQIEERMRNSSICFLNQQHLELVGVHPSKYSHEIKVRFLSPIITFSSCIII